MNEILQSLTETSPILLILFKATLLLGLAWGLHFGLVRANPRWRVLLWRGTMIGLLFIPAAEFLSPKILVPIEPPPIETTSLQTSAPPPNFNQSPVPIAPMSTPSTKSTLSTTPPPPPQSKSIPWRNHLQEIALGLWTLIAIVFAGRRLQSLSRLRAILKQTETPPESLNQLGHEVAKHLNCKRSFLIRLTLEKMSPFLASILSPKLIIPKPALSEERPTDTLGILAHEIAHLKSNDLFWTALSKWVTVLYWFHPLAWKIPAAHSSACEQICDSTAAAYVGNSDAYSQTLARSALALMDLAPNQGLPMIRSSEISKRLKNLRSGKVWGALRKRWVASSLVLGIPLLALLGSLAFVEAKAEPALSALTGFWETDWRDDRTISLGIQEEGRFRLSLLPQGGERYADSGRGRLEPGGKGLAFVDERLLPIEWKVEDERLLLTLHFGRGSSDPKV
ncbi:MAG: M56 family metallopeptidase, partial [Candidatus Omnitrophica bacterium]|nr:M56 family metallopeptidase [Candidatus Omnitrophota bacterium]